GTLSGNPIGMVAGLETLKKMERLSGWSVLNHRTEKFSKKLNENFQKKNNGLIVDQYASLFWIRQNNSDSKPLRSSENISPEQGHLFKGLFLKCLEAGLYLAPNAYEVGFISLAHTDEILTESINIITKASEI
ncbi:MAG: aspartate aminotransferase family protein, partial [Bdellovibrionaceae bacterium]|nr:aspartate aminotransferase family protein [Pseudobdellovibrionaceae bacterium]